MKTIEKFLAISEMLDKQQADIKRIMGTIYIKLYKIIPELNTHDFFSKKKDLSNGSKYYTFNV